MEIEVAVHLHIELDTELGQRLRKLVPPGIKSAVIRALLVSLLNEIEKNGRGIIGLVLDDAFDMRMYLHGRDKNGKAAK